jgi:hypothetical protein
MSNWAGYGTGLLHPQNNGIRHAMVYPFSEFALQRDRGPRSGGNVRVKCNA